MYVYNAGKLKCTYGSFLRIYVAYFSGLTKYVAAISFFRLFACPRLYPERWELKCAVVFISILSFNYYIKKQTQTALCALGNNSISFRYEEYHTEKSRFNSNGFCQLEKKTVRACCQVELCRRMPTWLIQVAFSSE